MHNYVVCLLLKKYYNNVIRAIVNFRVIVYIIIQSFLISDILFVGLMDENRFQHAP